ncbi:uncharacterized protein LOC129799534 [Phlebotomus papatasi]|uniref:uncharacterized protein LOC129799534 n=1 Tax=Phlebotomus papatasi TaxID=29031 RepID=UPI0024834280|nr:uncharacterized protein LOC129799534 [Phlebotomus papatasi]
MSDMSNIYFVDVEPKGEPGEPMSDIAQEVDAIKVFQSWGLLPRTIERLIYCGIKGLEHLEHMTLADMEIIFNQDSQLGEKILFRKCLRKWKDHNGFEPLVPDISYVERPPKYFRSNSYRDLSPEPFNGRISPAPKDKDFNLRELLRDSLKGVNLLSSYEKNFTLTNKEQCYICQVTVDYHMRKYPRMKMSLDQIVNYVREIIKAFPSELESTYYVPRSKSATKAPQGKLYHRYLNVYSKIRKESIKSRESTPSDFG